MVQFVLLIKLYFSKDSEEKKIIINIYKKKKEQKKYLYRSLISSYHFTH